MRQSARQSADRPPVLMVVHAHPDDESSQTGGTLARYAAAGCRTVLVTCTDGAQGDAAAEGAKPGQAGHDPRRVAEHRAVELESAARALGVRDLVTLGYPDSGVSDDGDSAVDSFSARELTPMVTRMVGLMRRFAPDVVVTYPPNGLSGHPDHVRTHDLVVAAHRELVDEGVAPRLYYIEMSVSRLREVQQHVRAAFGDEVWVPPEDLGIDDAEITTVIDVAPFWADKLAALAAHASQPDAALLLRLFTMADDSTVRGAKQEEYVRAYPPMDTPAGSLERDFFEPQRLPRSSGTSTACS
jgi:LmbE family N-acetylglucosaminyl deacetylase